MIRRTRIDLVSDGLVDADIAEMVHRVDVASVTIEHTDGTVTTYEAADKDDPF